MDDPSCNIVSSPLSFPKFSQRCDRPEGHTHLVAYLPKLAPTFWSLVHQYGYLDSLTSMSRLPLCRQVTGSEFFFEFVVPFLLFLSVHRTYLDVVHLFFGRLECMGDEGGFSSTAVCRLLTPVKLCCNGKITSKGFIVGICISLP